MIKSNTNSYIINIPKCAYLHLDEAMNKCIIELQIHNILTKVFNLFINENHDFNAHYFIRLVSQINFKKAYERIHCSIIQLIVLILNFH